MKTLVRSIFLIACILLLFFRSFGQDYIINQKGDTIFCQLKRTFITQAVKYRTDPKGKFSSVDKAEVREYFFSKDSTSWVLKTLPKTSNQIYIQWLEKGRINFYEYIETSSVSNGKTTQYSSTTYQYADKGSDTLKLIHSNGLFASNKKGRKILENFLADNSHLLEVFKNNRENYTLSEFIHTYNKQYLLNKGKKDSN